jgi:hypothetical protein
MRDRLTHHYFDVDLAVLWATITEDFPLLLDALPDEPPRADHGSNGSGTSTCSCTEALIQAAETSTCPSHRPASR